MTEAELLKITNDFHMTKPFRRKSYIAMLLGFYPCSYTLDYDDREIMYGQKSFDKIDRDMNYISCKRLLLKAGFKDEKLIRKLYEENHQKFGDLLRAYKVPWASQIKGLWYYFTSYYFENEKFGFHKKDIQHRLYLTIGLNQRGKFVEKFIDECVDNGVPYYFKVFGHKGQTDTVVIYCKDEENMKSTIGVIDKIYASTDNKDIRDNTKLPAPHLYKVNDYIGYGMEPKIDGRNLSYTMLIDECAHSVNDKVNDLRRRILDDFNNGTLYRVNNISTPNINVARSFASASRSEKFQIFNKYFPYINAVYGKEIHEIVDEVEQNLNTRLNAASKGDSTVELTQMLDSSTTKAVGNATKTGLPKQ